MYWARCLMLAIPRWKDVSLLTGVICTYRNWNVYVCWCGIGYEMQTHKGKKCLSLPENSGRFSTLRLTLHPITSGMWWDVMGCDGMFFLQLRPPASVAVTSHFSLLTHYVNLTTIKKKLSWKQRVSVQKDISSLLSFCSSSSPCLLRPSALQ